jgi:valyl-tRNA synthetase
MKLSKAYEPKQYESDIYALWEKSGAFVPTHRGSNKNFSMVFPLPNANGNLHLGHGLTNAIYDIPIRYHRMKGEAVLYLPGADHAGFETQVVYEKQLAKEGKSRFDFTREELYGQIMDFVQMNKGNFENQFRRLGASCDWTRYTFTLDEKVVNQAYATFKKMWDEKLVYRGERLVNYCTFHGTSFADIEVEHKEVTGKIWTIKYPLTDGSGEVVVATTRPETMLGDTAVAVHPDDERYKKVIGKTVTLPITGREVPVLADSFVDRDFGTGAVKITPAHDPNDYEVAQRHSLPMISVIGYDGLISHIAPEKYRRMTVKEARKAVVEDLEKQGLVVEALEHVHNVGHCYKCGTVIEPLLKEQWFVDMQPLAKEAIQALKGEKITFYPTSKRTQLIKYLENLRDWNISRQIAWGIPIPAFQNLDNPEDWIFDTRVDQEIIEVNGQKYRRDPDVFDTWFSSSSWPYVTLNFPDGEDFKQFYPTSLLDTGGEILYPWVSRMIMLGLYETGEVPFKEVYIHGYVMAEDGSKMSKSLGNVIDPLPVIDQHGSDALRMGLISGRVPGVNRGYDPRRIEEARNFANKLWNVARYIEGILGEKIAHGQEPKPTVSADHWIIHRLSRAIKEMSQHLDSYRFSEAYDTLYHLVWDDVADWYIEASKEAPNTSVLNFALETILKLAHPFAPFVSETIWQTLHEHDDSLLITSEWPKQVKSDQQLAKDFEKIMEIVSETRQIKTMLGVKGGALYFKDSPFLTANSKIVAMLARMDEVKHVYEGKGLHLTGTTENAWLDIDEETAKQFHGKLQERRRDITSQLKNLETRLSNESYLEKAPKKLIDESKTQQKDLGAELELVEKQLKQFGTFYV